MNLFLDDQKGAESKPMQILWHEDIANDAPNILLDRFKRESIPNAHVILVERKLANRPLVDFVWLDDAIKLLQENSLKKIVLISVAPMQCFLRKEDKYADVRSKFLYVMSFPNVRFFDAFSVDSLQDVFDLPPTNFASEEIASAFDVVTEQSLASIKHDLQYVNDPYNPQQHEMERYNAAITKVKATFPSRTRTTDRQVIDFVLNTQLDLPQPMKGKSLSWVYTDVDGTLIDYVEAWSPLEWTQRLRQKVVDRLLELEKQGYAITIRTGGIVAEKEKILRDLGVPAHRPVVSKYDYGGATVEIAFDDVTPNTLYLQNKLRARQHINTAHWDA